MTTALLVVLTAKHALSKLTDAHHVQMEADPKATDAKDSTELLIISKLTFLSQLSLKICNLRL